MKHPFQLFLKIDAYLIARLNDLYLWAFDWTGVFVGTIMFLNGIIPVLNMIRQDHMWSGAIFMLCTLLMSAPRYWTQSKSVEAYNATVLLMEGSALRYFFVLFNTINLIVDFFNPKFFNIWYISSDLSLLLMWYLFMIKIRDRQKKDFKLPSLAMEKSS